jgi:malignant T-cell-amplified sequence
VGCLPEGVDWARRYSLDDVASMTMLKSSIQRGIKSQVAENFPLLEPVVDELIPKGEMQEAKGRDRINFIVVNKEALFFRHRDGPLFPTLRLLHKCASLACAPVGGLC